MAARPATLTDIPTLHALGACAADESPRHRGRYNPRKAEALVRGALGTLLVEGPGGAFVAEDEGRIVGVLLGEVAEHAILDLKIAHEYAFYVLPEYRGRQHADDLLVAYEQWARQSGAHDIMVGDSALFAPRALRRFYCRRGYVPYEYGYGKELRK